jgi:hypothetical protein
MNYATELDHVGIVGHNLGSLAAAFEAVGFHLTPVARHAGGRTGNRCVMLRNGGYLELLSTIDGGKSATLDRFLARFEGAHIIALRIDDENAVLERLRLAFGAAPEISHTNRAVDDTETDGSRVRFSLITPPDPPEGRVHLIRHQTPDALWQTGFLRHPNRAVALDQVVLVAPEPATTAAWYSRLAGRPVAPDPAGGYALALTRGRIRMLPPGVFDAPTPPCIAALTLRTSDGTAAIRRLLDARGTRYAVADDSIQVKVAGVTLRFN